ncbi:MAG TPA: hypothetical protein VF905_08975 [Nitrospirota bacterium]
MDRVLEFIDLWMKAQKEFMDQWVKSQKEFMENWLAATQKMQESFLAMGGPREGETKETFDLYKAWLTTMANSSKVMSEEATKVQETWKTSVERQMDLNRELVKNFSDLFNKAADRK